MPGKGLKVMVVFGYKEEKLKGMLCGRLGGVERSLPVLDE